MKKIIKNILFIMPPSKSTHELTGESVASYKELPYGLLSIASYVKVYSKKNIQIQILDLNASRNIHYKDILERKIEEFEPDIVGISGLFSSMFDYVNEFSVYVKDKNPDILLVVGGNVSTNAYKLLFKHNGYIDGACFSEGEVPVLDLIEADNPFEAMEKSPSWITHKKIAKGIIPVAAFIHNLDEIPPIDFSMIDIDKYDSRYRNNNPIARDENGMVRLPFITTRGCPFNCIFCAAGSLSGKKVRFMSAERVISDIIRAKEKYNMRRLVINDDQSLIDKGRIKKILEAVVGLNMSLEFPTGLNVKFIDEEIALLLKKAGLEVVNLAIESGSEYVLKNIIDKPMKLSDVKPATKLLRKLGFFVHGFFIFGLPGEREEDRKATVDLIKDVGIDWSNISAAAPLKGSRLYDICLEKGYIDDNNDLLDSHVYQATIRTSEIDPDVLTEYIYQVNLDVNFVNNHRMKTGEYDVAKGYFSNVVENHPSHAFAHYYLSKAYEQLNGKAELSVKHKNAFADLVANNEKWKKYAIAFNLI
ncbi:radical SAM protein [bacterium]|nr:radical SAM protein [bacterium]